MIITSSNFIVLSKVKACSLLISLKSRDKVSYATEWTVLNPLKSLLLKLGKVSRILSTATFLAELVYVKKPISLGKTPFFIYSFTISINFVVFPVPGGP